MSRWSAGVVAALLSATVGSSVADPLLTYPLRIRGHTVRVELASDDDSRRIGLMFRRELPENGGMLFVYERAGEWAMWMKNTHVPLSVAFIDSAGRIINIEDMQPLTENTHSARGPARYALEVNQSWFRKRGIRNGDRVLGLNKIPGAR